MDAGSHCAVCACTDRHLGKRRIRQHAAGALLYAWNGYGWLSSLFFLTLYFGFPVLAGYLTLKRPPRGNYLVCVLISAGEALSAACFYTALAPLDGTVFTLSPMRYALMIVMGVGIAAYIGAYLTAWDGSN